MIRYTQVVYLTSHVLFFCSTISVVLQLQKLQVTFLDTTASLSYFHTTKLSIFIGLIQF